MSEYSDASLVVAYLGGSADAFRVLVERYAPLIYALARREGPAGLAEDVTQAVFLLLAQRAKDIRHPHLLAAWLLRVAHYCAAEARRSAARRQRHEQKAADMVQTVITDPVVSEPDALEAHLHAALQALGASDRTAIVLRYFREQPLAEIGAALSISEEAAKKRVARAVGKLRKILLRQHVPVSAALLSAAFAKSAGAALPALAAKIATVALAKSATGTSAALIAKGAAKLMAYTTAKFTAAAAVGVLAVAAGTTALVHRHQFAQVIAAPPVAASALPIAIRVVSSPAIRILPNDPVPTIEVRDRATHALLAGTTIQLIASAYAQFPHADAPPSVGETISDDTLHLPYPATLADDVVVTAFKEGYVPIETRWPRLFPGDRAPDHFSLTLEKGTTIGGRVLDVAGSPLSGATVLVDVQKRYDAAIQVSTLPFAAVTNGRGEWTLAGIPETYDKLTIGASHPLCLEGGGYVKMDFAATPDPVQLRSHTHTLRLERGTLLSGTVFAPDGKPHKAAITVGSWAIFSNQTPDILTTDDGRFQLGCRKNVPLILAAHAPGFASVISTITLGDQPAQLNITLAPAKPLTAHIVDPHGNPIPNATVVIDYWLDARTHLSARDFPLTFISDSAGNITWTEAPDKPLTASISAPGCLTRADAPLIAGTPNPITLFPTPLVHVHAISAITGQPIADARLVIGTADHRSHDEPQWLDYPEARDTIRPQPDGSQRLTFHEQHDALLVRAAGDHYLPTDSPPLPLDGHDYDVTLPLAEGERLTGQLLNADGSPLPHTTVWLDAYFLDIYDAKLPMEPAAIRRDPTHYATTDQDGNFSFPPQEGDYVLVVANDKGYALAHGKKFETTSTLTVAPWATVHGTVSPARAGIPIQAETTSYYIGDRGSAVPQYSATTDAAGHFTFTHVFAGEYRLTVNPDVNQKGVAEKTFKVRAGRTVAVTISAPPS